MTSQNDQDPSVQGSERADSDTTHAVKQEGLVGTDRSNSRQWEPLKVGEVLGRYEIIERLDGGGMGVVYRARHTALGKFVALKVVSTRNQASPQGMDRFFREMQAVGRLDPHPNVLNAYDAGDEAGIQYIATELIDGIQLANLISRTGPLSVSEACKIVAQAALGLDHLRKHNLVHRDVKPSNLMLTRDGMVKVVDMGLALLRDEQAEQLTLAGETMGSIDYMAPEQWRDCHAVDYRSDVYSLGCTFYCLLAGHAPFRDHPKGSVSRMRAHLQSDFPDIRKTRGDVPGDAIELLAAMVVKDPSQRLSDLVSLSKKLNVIASGDLRGLVQRCFLQDPSPPSRVPSPKPLSMLSAASMNAPTRAESEGKIPANSGKSKAALFRRNGRIGLAIVCLIGVVGFGVSRLGDDVESQSKLPLAAQDDSPKLLDANASMKLLSEPIAVCIGHQTKVTDVVFLDSENRVASISDDGVLCLFDLNRPSQPLQAIKVAERAATAIAYDLATHTLAIVSEDGLLQIRSAQDGALLQKESLGIGFTGMAFVPGKDTILTSDWNGEIRRFDLSENPVKNSLIFSRGDPLFDVEVAATGTFMAWAGREPIVSLFDVGQQTAMDLLGHKQWVYEVAISPDGEFLASAGHEGIVRIWQLPSGKPLTPIEHVVPQTICFFPDSHRLAVGGRDSVVQVWDVRSHQRIQRIAVGNPVNALALSANSKRMATAADEGMLKVWNLSLK
ncbi:WD40 repeat domain-containing serine/threonine protein kinase [Novipirellula artificiosorum]|uniref:Serine/threonine-protein kinase StkP n=1 Tax=Novipirellula artificiosorum TaxID=2528016 RepID=A0A5C6DYL9_9BACT|nr:serine/threonine-protein kinase [Novipirellula artificiosorum]TWU42533.1 Serine/threonine-protein kinase StkP [Novipirellula artificiosorum]